MREGFHTVDTEAAEMARRRHNQMIELADWDALDLDILASDRAMWSEGAGPMDESAKVLPTR